MERDHVVTFTSDNITLPEQVWGPYGKNKTILGNVTGCPTEPRLVLKAQAKFLEEEGNTDTLEGQLRFRFGNVDGKIYNKDLMFQAKDGLYPTTEITGGDQPSLVRHSFICKDEGNNVV